MSELPKIRPTPLTDEAETELGRVHDEALSKKRSIEEYGVYEEVDDPDLTDQEILERDNEKWDNPEVEKWVQDLNSEALEAAKQQEAKEEIEALEQSEPGTKKVNGTERELREPEKKVSILTRYDLFMEGVRGENARRAIALIEHLQANYYLHDTEMAYNMSEEEAQEWVEKMKKKGYETSVTRDEWSGNDGYDYKAWKKEAYHFQRDQLSWIRVFAENSDDPVSVFERIAPVLCNDKFITPDTFLPTRELRQVLENEVALKGVDCIREAGIRIDKLSSVLSLENIAQYGEELRDPEINQFLYGKRLDLHTIAETAEALSSKDTRYIFSRIIQAQEIGHYEIKKIMPKLIYASKKGHDRAIAYAIKNNLDTGRILDALTGSGDVEVIDQFVENNALKEHMENDEFATYQTAMQVLAPDTYSLEEVYEFFKSPVKERVLAIVTAWSKIEPDQPIRADLLRYMPSNSQRVEQILDPETPVIYQKLKELFNINFHNNLRHMDRLLYFCRDSEMRDIVTNYPENIRRLAIGEEMLEFDATKKNQLISLVRNPRLDTLLWIADNYLQPSGSRLDQLDIVKWQIRDDPESADLLKDQKNLHAWQEMIEVMDKYGTSTNNGLLQIFIKCLKEGPSMVDKLRLPAVIAYIRRRESTERVLAVMNLDDKTLDRLGQIYELYDFLPHIDIRQGFEDNVSAEVREAGAMEDDEFMQLILDPERAKQYKKAMKNLNRQTTLRLVYFVSRLSPEVLKHIKSKDKAAAISENLERLGQLPYEQQEQFSNLLTRLQRSPSKEVKRIMPQIFREIIDSGNPEEVFEIIEGIFVENNLPLIGKVYRIFCELNPSSELQQKGLDSPVLSRLQREAMGTRETRFERVYSIFRNIIYRDLLKSHIYSGNRNLEKYIEALQIGQDIFDRLDAAGVEGLSEDEKRDSSYALQKINMLFLSSHLGSVAVRANPDIREIDTQDIEGAYRHLRDSLGVNQGQTINQRIEEMFLKPLGFESFGEVLEAMNRAKKERDENSRRLAASGRFQLEAGDLIKGVRPEFIENILQNGSLAKDFLGASASSDGTPLDTDTSMVLETEAEKGFEAAYNASLAKSYGSLLFVFKDKGQFLYTTDDSPSYDKDKYELFAGTLSKDKHRCIRTGIASTEIEYMILKTPNQLQAIGFEIAKNGYYIPIVDTKGQIIFTPQMYDELRRSFDGIEKYDGEEYDFTPTAQEGEHFQDIDALAQQIDATEEETESVNEAVKQKVRDVLIDIGIRLESESQLDHSILGAQIDETGSTARHTNIPGNFDFDFSVRLDEQDIKRLQEISAALTEALKPETKNSHSGNEYIQMRLGGCSLIPGKSLDIDIALIPKWEAEIYASHDAVEDKLTAIKESNGEEAYRQALANIVLTKKILKEGHAYKKMEHGGLGGIGVENWILLNGGNMIRAFETFWTSAHDEDGNVIPLNEFAKKYPIIDPGENLRHPGHDNFSERLREEGYRAMLIVIGEYLDQEPGSRAA